MKKFIIHFGCLILSLVIAGGAVAQTPSEISYQGRLVEAGNPVTGTRFFRFTLFDEHGAAIPGATLLRTLPISGGTFTAALDFGAAPFAVEASRSLQIEVKINAGDAYTLLNPRQALLSVPFSIKSKTADNATRLGGLNANSYVQTNDSRLTDTRTPTAGSGFYVQNSPPTPQAANFNISGNGFVGGNLGIGTTAPQSKLTLQTPTNNYGFLHTDGAITFGSFVGGITASVGGWIGTTTNHPLHFFTGNGTAQMSLLQNGTTRIKVMEITGGSDLAENFELADAQVKPGMVVAIDPQQAGKLVLARGAYNRRVAGIISGANNLSAGMVLPDLKNAKNSLPVALSGRVWVFADAGKHPIQPGDLLTTSETAGYAMKVTKYKRAQGAIIGKAMTELKSGTGLVLVLVNLQ